MRCANRAMLARIWSAVFVHTNGLVLPFIITVTYSGVEAPAPQGARSENTWSQSCPN